MVIPNIWENKKRQPNHQPDNFTTHYFAGLIRNLTGHRKMRDVYIRGVFEALKVTDFICSVFIRKYSPVSPV